MTQKNFNIALKKGEIGEKIIIDFLEKKGWIAYHPFTKNKAHYFDILATKDKNDVIAIDVKTKARLNKWNAQGINIKHYNEYLNFVNKTNVNFYLFFIDDKIGDVHYANIKDLKNSFYPNDYIIAWELKEMKYLFNIGFDKINELTQYDQRNYEFQPFENIG